MITNAPFGAVTQPVLWMPFWLIDIWCGGRGDRLVRCAGGAVIVAAAEGVVPGMAVCRALRLPPSYHPVPGAPVYHVSVDNRMVALAAEHDLWGPLLDLVIAVLAMGDEVLAPLPGSFANRSA